MTALNPCITMKNTLPVKYGLLFLLPFVCIHGYSQNKPSLQKSWIKTNIENLSARPIEPDTLYIRYTFTKSELRFSFYPGWDAYKQPASQNGNNLTIGFDTYKIEELTDTSLVLALEGFRRFRFLAETYLANKKESLEPLGQYNGQPLYRANRFVTPRYKKEKLGEELGKSLEGYHGTEAAYFLASFVVTAEGRIENVQIVHGISEGFANEFTRQILKTSRQWQPALVNGQSVQTQMQYEIKYLKSLVPYKSGRLN